MSSNEKPDGPWSDETAAKFETKSYSKYFDPCQEAAARSLNCLRRNAGDKTMCQDYFEAYRDCKKQWMDKRREERFWKRS